MNWSRQWARLMAVAIVMIVACFAAPLAEAHEGHTHHAAPAAADRPVAGPSSGAVVAIPAAAASAIKAAMTDRAGPQLRLAMSKTPVARTVFARAGASAPNDRGCDGHCCSMGSACCSPGMAAQSALDLPPITRPGRLFAGPQARLTSLAPEALPKPPKAFA